MKKETFVAECHKHWSCFIGRGIIALFFVILALMELSDAEGKPIVIVSLLIAACCVLSAFIVFKTDFIAVTETKLVGKKALFAPLSYQRRLIKCKALAQAVAFSERFSSTIQ